MGRFTLSYADYDGERSSVGFPASDLTEANIAAEYTQSLALQTATEAIALGNLLQTEWTAKTSPQGVGRSTDPQAQREAKALVEYYDSVTFKPATVTIPTVDLSKQNTAYPGVFFLDGSTGNHADWSAFVTAFEAFVPGPAGNNAVVYRITHVGANL